MNKLIVWFFLYVTFLHYLPFPYPKNEREITPIDVSELSQIYAQHHLNNTVMIVPCNFAFLKYLKILFCSMNQFMTTKHVIVQALDDQIEKELLTWRQNQNLSFGVIPYKEMYQGTTNEVSQMVKRDAFLNMMRARGHFLKSSIDTGYDLIFADSDTVYLQDPFVMTDHDIDFQFSTDNRYLFHETTDPLEQNSRFPTLCFGFFKMKSNNRTRQLIDSLIIELERQVMNDQDALNYLMNGHSKQDIAIVGSIPHGLSIPPQIITNTSLTVRILDQFQVANGVVYEFSQGSSREFEKKYMKELVVLHGNGQLMTPKWTLYQRNRWNEFVVNDTCSTTNPIRELDKEKVFSVPRQVIQFLGDHVLVIHYTLVLVIVYQTIQRNESIYNLQLVLFLLTSLTFETYVDYRFEYRQLSFAWVSLLLQFHTSAKHFLLRMIGYGVFVLLISTSTVVGYWNVPQTVSSLVERFIHAWVFCNVITQFDNKLVMVLNLVGAGTWFFAVSNLFTVYQIQVFHGIFKGIFVLGSLQLPIRDLELDLKKQV